MQANFSAGNAMPTSNKPLFFGLAFIAVTLAGFAAYLWIALHWSYSEGERAGFMQKLSHKGWLCKTWEGELSLVALPGAAPEKFYFSVRDESIAQQINAAVGQRTALTYEQHKGLPTSCFGETEYFVTAVKVVK
jgi:hypothetical protein